MVMVKYEEYEREREREGGCRWVGRWYKNRWKKRRARKRREGRGGGGGERRTGRTAVLRAFTSESMTLYHRSSVERLSTKASASFHTGCGPLSMQISSPFVVSIGPIVPKGGSFAYVLFRPMFSSLSGVLSRFSKDTAYIVLIYDAGYYK